MSDFIEALSNRRTAKLVKAFMIVLVFFVAVCLVFLLAIPRFFSGDFQPDLLWWKLVIIGLILLAGYTANQVRQWHLFSYALLEVAFGIGYGIWAACNIGVPTDMTPSQGFTLAGCVYIMVRGASNLREAQKSKR